MEQDQLTAAVIAGIVIVTSWDADAITQNQINILMYRPKILI